MHIIAFMLYIDKDEALERRLSWLAVVLLIVSYAVCFLSFLWYWRNDIKFIWNKVVKVVKKLFCLYKAKPVAKNMIEVAAAVPTHNTLSFRRNAVADYSKYRESILSS